MRKLIPFIAMVLSTQLSADAQTNTASELMQIEIIVGGEVAKGHLLDNPTAREFAAMLPLELSLKDYGKLEKVSDLTKSLTKKNAPAGYEPSKGDITYFAPWGNLAIFRKEFDHSTGLILLGKIGSGMESLDRTGEFSVRIQRAEKEEQQD